MPASTTPSPQIAPTIATLDLTPEPVSVIEGIVNELVLAAHGSTPEELSTLAAARRDSLPQALLSSLDRLSAAQHEPGLIVRGLRVDDRAIGPTPSHWKNLSPLAVGSPTLREELTLVLISEALGSVFGYSSLQAGRLVHNLMPIAGAETDQSGHGSKATLDWHTEDAFTPFRADILALFGLRNHDEVATTFAGIDALAGLDPSDIATLSAPRFAVVPDDEHLRFTSTRTTNSILGDLERPHQLPVLHVGPRGLEMVIDSVYMSPIDDGAAAVWQRATAAMDAALQRVSVRPGELLLIDNRRAVHGREDFPARYDGTDRWLLKASITSRFEASAAFRASPTSRTLL